MQKKKNSKVLNKFDRANYSMEFFQYEAVPRGIQEEELKKIAEKKRLERNQ